MDDNEKNNNNKNKHWIVWKYISKQIENQMIRIKEKKSKQLKTEEMRESDE